MSGFSDALKALRTVLLMQEDVRALKEAAQAQSVRLTHLAEAHGDLRDRVAHVEGFIKGATATSRQRRIED